MAHDMIWIWQKIFQKYLRNTSNMKLARESMIFMINGLSTDEPDSSKYQKLQKKTTHITITYM